MSSKDEKLLKKRHSLSHVLAQAVIELYPGTQLAIGPAIETGFYYDFDLSYALKEADLPAIESRMREILQTAVPFKGEIVSYQEAQKRLNGQIYKLEILDELPSTEAISFYQNGPFEDLCRGPHVGNLSEIDPQSFCLLHLAGAYWRGDEKRPMLTRIYGAAFHTAKELRIWLKEQEELRKNEHKKLGRELDLFSLHEESGPGLVFWHPKTARLRIIIEDFWRKLHTQHGYEFLFTPHVGKETLWQTSGHLDFFKENLFPSMELDKGQRYYVKPMNCPFHMLIYKNRPRSYRELPLRWAELGTVYRYERSGVLNGLLRVRGFTQDDAHLFCTAEQVESEILEALQFSLLMWKSFGFKDIKAYLATRPDKAIGEDRDWQIAQEALVIALKKENLDYEVDEGGGAFYGPKIDLKIKDVFGRQWQMSTIQFDFNLPERFGLHYVERDGSLQRPYVIHRALLGSLERFLGLLIEHYGGSFPLWLAPLQIQIIPVADAFIDYAQQTAQKLRQLEWRVHVDNSSQRLNAKIRQAQEEKIPLMLILGEEEQKQQCYTLRTRQGQNHQKISWEELLHIFHEKQKEEHP